MKTINPITYKRLHHLVSVLIDEDMIPTIAIGSILIDDIQLVGKKMITFHSGSEDLWLYSDFSEAQILEMISVLEKHLVDN